MLDCGGRPPYNNQRGQYESILPQVTSVVITGTTANECGALPLLRRLGFKGLVYLPAALEPYLLAQLFQLQSDLRRDFCGFQPTADDVNNLGQVSQCLSVENARQLEENKYLRIGQFLSAKFIVSGREAAGVYLKHEYFQEELFYAGGLLKRDPVNQVDFESQNEKYGSQLVKLAIFRELKKIPNVPMFSQQAFLQQLEKCRGVTFILCSGFYDFAQAYLAMRPVIQSDEKYKSGCMLLAEADKGLTDIISGMKLGIPVLQKITKEKIVFLLDAQSSLTRQLIGDQFQVAENQVIVVAQKQISRDTLVYSLVSQSLRRRSSFKLQVLQPVVKLIELQETEVKFKKDEVLLKDLTLGQLSELDFEAIMNQLKNFKPNRRHYERPVKRNPAQKILILEFDVKLNLLQFLARSLRNTVQLCPQGVVQNRSVQYSGENLPGYFAHSITEKDIPNHMQRALCRVELPVQKDSAGEFGYKFAFKTTLERPKCLQSEQQMAILAHIAALIDQKYDVYDNLDGTFEIQGKQSRPEEVRFQAQEVQKTTKQKEIPQFRSAFDPKKLQAPLKRRDFILRKTDQLAEAQLEEREATLEYLQTEKEIFCGVSLFQSDNQLGAQEFKQLFRPFDGFNKTGERMLMSVPFSQNIQFALENTIHAVKISLQGGFKQRLFGSFSSGKFAVENEASRLMPAAQESHAETEESLRARMERLQFEKTSRNNYVKGEAEVQIEAVKDEVQKITVTGRAVEGLAELVDWV